jgi:hypothetical protein
MFWSRRIRLPLTIAQREDLERLIHTSIERVGADRVRQIPLVTELNELSLDASTPDSLLRSAEQALLERFPTMPGPVVLQVRDLDDVGYHAVYEPAVDGRGPNIVVAREILSSPLVTLMELAYQFAIHYWESIDDATALNRDPRNTHLLPICCGLGILASDACLVDRQWSVVGYTGWSMSRTGYYNAAEIGYALALLARFRQEASPHWLARLRPDSRVTASAALQYFADLKTSRD